MSEDESTPLNVKEKDENLLNLIFKLSWAVNIFLCAAKVFALVETNYSKAVAASLADSMVDILSQMVLALSQYYMEQPSHEYPVGRNRLEALGVIACSCIMSMSSFEVIQYAFRDLYNGFNLNIIPMITANVWLYVILGGGILSKWLLWVACKASKIQSTSLVALAEDHLNDVVSNIAAVLTAVVAAKHIKFWWVDGIGAILISAWIISRWFGLTMDEMEKIIGKSAPEDFISKVEEIASKHHPSIEVDVTRAYHFGANYIVEMEIVLPKATILADSHDVALELQHKIELLEEVERAFVHVDYEKRHYPEHKVERRLLEAKISHSLNSVSNSV
mmetsp:Transcript_16043/g.23813  ORF Transcript_16043/g.23813 Transcript_16043/m.23813 type:complete len:333 (-) Transcript_16043:20-1018(-)